MKEKILASELLLINAKWAIFQLYHVHGKNKLHFDEIKILSALYLINMLS